MITSSNNPQMKNLALLMKKSKERKSQGLFVVEGPKMCFEAPFDWVEKIYVAESFYEDLASREKLIDYLNAFDCALTKQENGAIKGKSGEELYEVVSDNVFKSASDTQTPQGILALIKMPHYEIQDLLQGGQTMLLCLESVQDPGNLGTMVRTGEGAGVTGVLMNATTVDLFNPKTIRSTMGSIYRIPFVVAEDFAGAIDTVKKAGVSLYAAHLKGTGQYDDKDYTGPCGFMIGNEGNGLTDETAGLASDYIKIPMEGQVESLNAAMSAGILMYECNRQRRKQG